MHSSCSISELPWSEVESGRLHAWRQLTKRGRGLHSRISKLDVSVPCQPLVTFCWRVPVARHIRLTGAAAAVQVF
jgi:hypothetical protein